MTTCKVTHRRTLARIFDSGRYRNVIVTVDPSGALVSFRLLGTRRSYALPVGYLYWTALHKAVALEKANKVKARKAKRRKKK